MSDSFGFGLSLRYSKRPPAPIIHAAVKALRAHFQEWARSINPDEKPRLKVTKKGRHAPSRYFSGLEFFSFEITGVKNLGFWKRAFSQFLNSLYQHLTAAIVAPAIDEPSAVIQIAGYNWFTTHGVKIDHARAQHWA